MRTNIELIALVSGAACVAGLVLAVVALVGTRRPPGRAPGAGPGLGRLWRGSGSTAREQRAHQSLLVGAVVAGALAFLLTGLPVVGLLVAVAVPGAPWLFSVGRAEQRAIARIEAVGEWTRRLKDVSATGQGLQQAIIGTVTTAPEEIQEEVRLLAARLQAGWLARSALLAFADEIGDPVCDQVVAALILHLTDRGERLGDVLGSIASAAAAEVATRREIEAKRTQPRFAVRFLTGMTLATIAYGLLNREYVQPYDTPFGQLVMAVLGAAFVALLAWVRSMSQPPRPARFLPAPDPNEVVA
ncbi:MULTISPECIES: type II secretion system F family protein [unclassified Micromonospora]|uniref:type II secretion system F family protein n=1 Tax=unclassified Micromonospora TaxID=2617518 RepID=UPI0022B6776C|nr:MULTISPECIES: type II secretion system F family protein [unclassified Micromonospora]MCZ7421522.1 type II secretion system F family protein [Verrucosispora sp. WMMA2121]WBB93791.1 type II secretion system F family protein [Verrucosispora sp. WMMC514]